jgi:putative transposase
VKKSRYSEEQIARILAEAATGEKTVREVCKANGVTEHTFYVWRKKYGGMQTDDIRRLRELEAENAALKRIVANQALEIEATRTVLRKNGVALPSVARERGY